MRYSERFPINGTCSSLPQRSARSVWMPAGGIKGQTGPLGSLKRGASTRACSVHTRVNEMSSLKYALFGALPNQRHLQFVAPALRQIRMDAELIQHAHDDVIHHLFERLRVVVKRGHRWKNHRAHAR
jgi:hypothetical protein